MRERGTASLELALLAPVLLVLVATVVASGRIVQTKSAVLATAREAARAASEATDRGAAAQAGREAASRVAAGLGLDPGRLSVAQKAGGFDRGGRYVVRVSYRVSLADLPGLGALPGSFVLSAEHAEPIQRFKSR